MSVRKIVISEIGKHQDLLEILKTRKMKWYGHTTQGDSLAKICLQGILKGGRSRGRPRKKWADILAVWTQPGLPSVSRRWLVRKAASSDGPLQRRAALRDRGDMRCVRL